MAVVFPDPGADSMVMRWDGMLKALDLAKGTADPEKQTAIFVPPEGGSD